MRLQEELQARQLECDVCSPVEYFLRRCAFCDFDPDRPEQEIVYNSLLEGCVKETQLHLGKQFEGKMA